MVKRITKALVLTLALLGCTSKTSPTSPPLAPPKELRIFTWSEYFKDDLLNAFEKETGIKVKADYYSSNEQMLSKIQLTLSSNEPGYDLIIPSDYMVRTLIELNLLSPLDHGKLPFLADFDAAAKNPGYDPGLKYALPLAIGVTGIAVNTNLVPNFPFDKGITWKEAFENPAYKGKLTVLDDTKEVLQAALIVAGKDLEKASNDDIQKAFQYLKAHKSQIKAFTAETRPVLEAEECGICMTYSGDVLSVAKDKKQIRFVIPKDGATLWSDNFAIPKNARNPDLAHRFISAVLAPEAAKAFTERTGYRTANLKAKALLAKEVAENPIIFPQEKASTFHSIVDRKDQTLMIDKEWTLLKSN